MEENKCIIECLGKDKTLKKCFKYFCKIHNSEFLSAEKSPKICWIISHNKYLIKLAKFKERHY